jgi:hypothetical protein
LHPEQFAIAIAQFHDPHRGQPIQLNLDGWTELVRF